MSRAADYYSTHGTNLLNRYRTTGDFQALQGAVDPAWVHQDFGPLAARWLLSADPPAA